MRLQTLMISLFVGISGCVTAPIGPSIAVMPAAGKPFDLFTFEEHQCRSWAEEQSGLSPQQAAENSQISGTVAGTALGAAAGTAIGALAGDVGAGAVAGAGVGLMEGTAIGSMNARYSAGTFQERYNIAYEQCMYAKGNQVQGFPAANMPASIPPPPPPPRY